MMRLIHRSFFSLAIVLMLFRLAGAQGATYTVQFKASPGREEAAEDVRQLKAKNISAYIVKSVVPGKGVFYRIRAGVFSNRNDANKFGANLQQRGLIAEFIVMTYEKPIDDFESSSASANQPQTKAPARTSQSSPNGEAWSATQERSERASLKREPASAPAAASKSASVARNDLPANPATNSTANSPARATPTPANNPGLSPSSGETTASKPPSGFARFQDPKTGYSFDYPDYWTAQVLSDKEAGEQRMSAGAAFTSEKDGAFLNVIWNELNGANNPADENDLVVKAILNGMSASDGLSKLEETARRVENQNGLIKTYLDLKASVQVEGQSAPLDYLAKAVIIRASRGILLVTTFYAKDSAPKVAGAVDRIIASARAPK
jgi:sporulation related protein